jgi:hypothetical protein
VKHRTIPNEKQSCVPDVDVKVRVSPYKIEFKHDEIAFSRGAPLDPCRTRFVQCRFAVWCTSNHGGHLESHESTTYRKSGPLGAVDPGITSRRRSRDLAALMPSSDDSSYFRFSFLFMAVEKNQNGAALFMLQLFRCA